MWAGYIIIYLFIFSLLQFVPFFTFSFVYFVYDFIINNIAWRTLYMAVHRQWSGRPCCCRLYFEQSVPTCHVCTPYVCFLRSLKAFLPMTFTTTYEMPACSDSCYFQTLKSFFLLTYLLTYPGANPTYPYFKKDLKKNFIGSHEDAQDKNDWRERIN